MVQAHGKQVVLDMHGDASNRYPLQILAVQRHVRDEFDHVAELAEHDRTRQVERELGRCRPLLRQASTPFSILKADKADNAKTR